VLQRAAEYEGDDLHVTMRVSVESAGSGDAVIIDHAQRAEAHVLRVAVIGERERVVAVEPAMIGVPAIFGFSDLDHNNAVGGLERWSAGVQHSG
jgi:hypothetical protein